MDKEDIFYPILSELSQAYGEAVDKLFTKEVRMKIVLEKNRVPHQASMTAEAEHFDIPLPEGTSIDIACKMLWQISMALGWQTASLSDFPPRCYISRSGLYCAYLADVSSE